VRIAIEVNENAFLPGVQPAKMNLIDVLLCVPPVGEDADFERVQDMGRPELEWDT
jgi:hypothetical protein